MAKTPWDPKLEKNHKWPRFIPWPLETTRSHHLSSKEGFPSSSGEDFSFLNAPTTQGSRSGAYMVIPNQVPNPSSSSKEDFSAMQSANSLEATRRPFKDRNHLAQQELGCQSLSGLF
ncbi:hypothetical protein O181_013951 [Austropuccinia psidii MF-1]|uniref:Uncharacterized protein n=1 Tax=Austropuccinia psidii MF-1 TaxID=1389203 RepID=A0A9Q3GNQ4_9BASI|nr:hypothetical protein [Austropuccinia psidii MF-1]